MSRKVNIFEVWTPGNHQPVGVHPRYGVWEYYAFVNGKHFIYNGIRVFSSMLLLKMALKENEKTPEYKARAG